MLGLRSDYVPQLHVLLRLREKRSLPTARIRMFTLMVGLASLAGLANAATVSFQSVVTYPVGTSPSAISSSDFNGDGKGDLAVVNSADGTVSVLVGNGDGTFGPPTTIAVDGGSIAAGDLNGDGRPDLVVTGTNRVDVLLGNGDGSFQGAQHFNTGVGTTALAITDLNSDGKPDLLVSNQVGVGVLIGNGDGTFQADVDYSSGPGTIVVGDFNGDNKMDVAVGSSSGVMILLGNGDGSLQSPVNQGGLPNIRVAVDFNKDGKLDLLVDDRFSLCGFPPKYCGKPLGVMFGNGDGTFQPTAILNAKSVTLTAFAADFDGDGNVDVAVISVSSMEIYAGDGEGSFEPPISFGLLTPSGGIVANAAAVDVNGDKAPDLVVANPGGGVSPSVGISLNNTGSDFSTSITTPSPSLLHAGQSASSTVSLKLLNSFSFPVSLSCSVQPSGASAPTCSLSSNSVTFDLSGQASATLKINAGASLTSRNSFQLFRKSSFLWFPVAGFALLGAGFSRKRRLLVILVGGALFSGLAMLAACGGGNGEPKSTAYTVMVTGSSGATQHSATVNVSVQ
jgi:FG-GAP-like repeat